MSKILINNRKKNFFIVAVMIKQLVQDCLKKMINFSKNQILLLKKAKTNKKFIIQNNNQ